MSGIWPFSAGQVKSVGPNHRPAGAFPDLERWAALIGSGPCLTPFGVYNCEQTQLAEDPVKDSAQERELGGPTDGRNGNYRQMGRQHQL